MSIERSEIERLGKDRDDELAILERNVYGRLKPLMLGKTATSGPKGLGRGEVTEEKLADLSRGLWWQIALDDEKAMGELEAMKTSVRGRPQGARPSLRGQGREAATRRRTAPRRDEDGQGLRGREAQASARRQDGRPSRQQGRHLQDPADRGHAAPGRRHLGRRRSEPAGRAFAHEHRPDLRNPPGLGRRPVWASRSRVCWKPGSRAARSRR